MDELDKNIEDIDNKIIIQTNSQYITNYFLPNVSLLKNKFTDLLTKDNLYKEFKNPYLICLTDEATYQPFFHNELITEEELIYIKKSIKLIPISYTVLSETMINYLTTFSSTLFNTFNFKNEYNEVIQTNADVLVCCIFRFKHVNICRYLKQFNGVSNFIDIYNSLLLDEYFGQSNNRSIIKQNHIIMINNMNESNYWTIYNNCRLNYTIKFNTNSFNLSINERLTDKNIDNVIKFLASTSDDNDYLAFLFEKSKYVDASSGIDVNGYKLYTISNNDIMNKITNECFNKLFDKLSEDVQYHLIMNILISKDLCHLVINNKYILNKIISKDHFKNNLTFMELYGNLLRYILGYTWIIMYMEESIKRSFIDTSDRFIFDIDTASLLPWYPYSIENIHICPYMPILVANNILNIQKNILGVEQHIYNNQNDNIKQITRYGICSKDIFIKRINEFISGKTNINILENIDWTNVAMSGSIMACCVPNYNTLMSKFILDKENFKIDFIGFINEYYKEADIDIMCNITNIYKFVDKINDFNNTLQNNIKKIYSIDSNLPITTIFTNKSASILINKHFINKYILEQVKLPYIDIISNLNQESIKKIVYNHYINWHKDYITKCAIEDSDKFFDQKYNDIYINIPIEEINIVLIKYENDPDNNNNIICIPKINYKFRISSYYLPHNFEFFQIKYDNFFSTVSQFHLPIVRSYYDGSQVYLTPSCISACMTFINIDYKYFAGKKDPIEIINKYRMRGFGTILNNKEITKLLEYSNLVPKWKKLYNLHLNSNSSVLSTVGLLNVHSSLFKPSILLNNTNTNNYIKLVMNEDYITIPYYFNDIINLISKIYNLNSIITINPTTINKYGIINCVKKWLINAYNDSDFNKQYNENCDTID